MNENNFNPYVRYSGKVTSYIPYPEMLCAFDYRMFYVMRGAFCVKITDRTFNLSNGGIAVIPPGTPYKLILDSENTAEYYVFNFDFSSDMSRQKALSPVFVRNFNEDSIFNRNCIEPFKDAVIISNVDILEPFLNEIYCENSVHLKSALMKYVLTKLVFLNLKKDIDKGTKKLIDDVKKYVEEQYNSELTNNSVAKEFGYHPYYLSSLFLKYENITLHKYIDSVRIKKAKEMLLLTDMTISEVGMKIGIPDASYFSKFFTKNIGVSPRKYRMLSR